MKKKVISLAIIWLCVASIAIVAFSACNPDDITHFRLDLNDKDADYTEEYRTANSIESRNIVKIVNKDLYKNFSTGLPKGSDMVAPSGKVFAGWYFDNKSYEGTEFSEYNWNRFQRDAADEDKRYVLYARWIPQGKQVVYFDLNSAAADYTEAYRARHNGFDHRTPEFIVDSASFLENFLSAMPKTADVVCPNDQIFGGWYFADDNTEFTAENYLAHVEAGAVQMRVVAHWTEKEKIYVYFNLPVTEPGSGKWFSYDTGVSGYAYIVTDNYGALTEVLPKADQIVYHRFDAPTSTEEAIKTGDEFATFEWAIGVYDDDFVLQETVDLNSVTWFSAVEAAKDGEPIYLVLRYSLKPEYEPNMNIE